MREVCVILFRLLTLPPANRKQQLLFLEENDACMHVANQK